jgi:DnaJ-related protein SCJ1
LTLKESLLGYTKQITHLDGHIVQIEHDGLTQPGSSRTVVGEGLPVYEFNSSYGDLIVTFNVHIPSELSEA